MHPSPLPESSLISEGSGELNQDPHTPRRASRHPEWDPSRPTSFSEPSLQSIAGTWLEGGESSAGAVGATRVLAPTAPRRPTRAVSSDFEDWETTVGGRSIPGVPASLGCNAGWEEVAWRRRLPN